MQDNHSATLITGASGGIGEELARVFAQHGHNLVLAARRRERLEAIADTLMKRHDIEVDVIVADLATPRGAADLYSEVSGLGREVSILVNNSGLLEEGMFLDLDIDQQCRILDVNVRALMQLTHYFGGDMRRRKSGRILNICSTSAFQPVPGLATYAASKAFVLSLSEALAMENADHGVTVTALCPGFVETEMVAKKDGGGHMQVPFVPLLTAAEVAEQAYKATVKGTPVYINGMSNRLLERLSHHQPRWLMHRIGKLMKSSKF